MAEKAVIFQLYCIFILKRKYMEATTVYFLITGLVSGTLAGLLGIGGGMIIVPVVVWVLAAHGYGDDNLIKVALGTSLAVIIPTSISSALAHYRRKTLRLDVFFNMLPGVIVGTIAGGFLVGYLPDKVLKIIFGVGCLLVAFKMFTQAAPKPTRSLPNRFYQAVVGSIIGAISTMLGIGGGTMTVPYLNWCNVPMRNAVGTSAAVGLPIAASGAVTLMLVGQAAENLPQNSIGFVYLPAFLAIGISAVIMAPFGAKLTQHVPVNALKMLMALIILAAGLKIIHSVI